MKTTSVKALPIPGCFELRPEKHCDDRGCLTKIWSEAISKRIGWDTNLKEVFWSTSKPGVVRGLHMQAPPRASCKLVWCPSGAIRDVLLDVRKGSPTFGKHLSVEVTAAMGNAVFIAAGVAHGFSVRRHESVTAYLTDAEYDPSLDIGILWDSLAIDWGVNNPIVSVRDQLLPPYESFESPSTFCA